MFLALGVAALILLAGTDLSIGRMVGMGMTTEQLSCTRVSIQVLYSDIFLILQKCRLEQE